MIKKAFFIVVPIIFVTVLIFLFGINTYNSKYEVFQSDGHIIAKNSKSTTEKVFFDTDTKYKTVDDNVYITAKDKDTITVPTESFIHYADGSISTFSKAVVLDLDDLNKEIFKYYNIFPETIFVKNGKNYSVNYLEKKLNFSNFLLKINNDKYMIIGQKMTLKIGGADKSFENTYLEVSYLDGNVIKIENQSVAYQSVDDEVLLELDNGVVLDLALKNIYKNKERKLAMGEITIDSDDNIQINAEDNKSITGDKNAENGENGSGNGGSGSNGDDTRSKLPDVNSGIVDTTVNTVEEIIDENARIKDPEFKVIDMDITSNRLRASVQITDQSAVLTGSINIKIIEYNTNKVIYESNDDSGSNIIEIENESLLPETNYVLILNSDYKKNNVTYNKDFVQKTFITDAIGVDVLKYFATENKLEVNVKKSDYSDVVSLDVDLIDKSGAILKTLTVPLNEKDNIVSFENLVHNTSYRVRAHNFVYNNSVISDTYSITNNLETLKIKPTIGETKFTIDKKESKFNLMVNKNSDPDGGIVTYRYEVYDARTINDSNSTPVSIIEKKNNASASLSVDGRTIERGVPYIFRTVMVFNDNEKEYEYVSEYSDVMMLDGVAFPTIRFVKQEVTFEKIRGLIEITDDGNTLDIDSGNVITVVYTDSVGNSDSFTASGTLRIGVNVNNLRSNETYSFALYSRVDLQDGNPAIDQCYIGSVIVKTEKPDPFIVDFGQINDVTASFAIAAQLKPANDGDTELEADTLTGLSFKLYRGRSVDTNPVKIITRVDKDLDAYSSDLRDKYYDNSFRVDPAFFGISNSDLTAGYYTLEITNAYDYTTYKNDLPILNNYYTFELKNAPDSPHDFDDAVEIYPIYNWQLPTDKKRKDLLDNTIVGYRFRANYPNTSRYAIKVHYYIKDLNDRTMSEITDNFLPTGDLDFSSMYLEDGLEPGMTDDKLHRGQTFYITYKVELDMDSDGRADLVVPNDDGVQYKSVDLKPPRQEPTFMLYPSTMNALSYTWKYKYSDIDQALQYKKLYSYIGNEKIGDGVEVTRTTTYKDVVLPTTNTVGLFSILANYELIDGVTTLEPLASHCYEGIPDMDFGKVQLSTGINRVIFQFLDFDRNPEKFEKISLIKIEFITDDNQVVTVNRFLDQNSNGIISVDYSEFANFKGKNITARVEVYYDSGVYGFESGGESDYFALQKMRNSFDEPINYYSFNGNSNLVSTKDSYGASKSFYTFRLNLNNGILTLTNTISEISKQLEVSASKFGMYYKNGGTYISPKKLAIANGVFDGTNSFEFDTIIPGVTIFVNGISSMNPLISNAYVKLTVNGVNGVLDDGKVYIKLQQLDDDNALSGTQVGDMLSFNLDDLTNPIEFTNLLPDTNYRFDVYGKIGSNYVPLYDIDNQSEGAHYYFKTVGNVGISNIKVTFVPGKIYGNRKLRLSYQLDKTIGYDYIKYNIYRIDSTIDGDSYTLLENVTLADSLIFKEKMDDLLIDIDNESGFITRNRYLIEIQPVLNTQNGEIYLEKSTYEYRFKDLFKPYFSASTSYNSSTNNMRYTVNVRDSNRVVVNGKYQIQIIDNNGNDVTPAAYASVDYFVTQVNNVFEVPINADSKYTFKILYKSDLRNDKNLITDSEKVFTLNSSGNSTIGLGTVYASTDIIDTTKVNLSFFDSFKLREATHLRYSIYDSNAFSKDGEIEFLPVSVTSGEIEFFKFQLPDSISNSGIYYIAMQFLDDDGNILAEETVEYKLL